MEDQWNEQRDLNNLFLDLPYLVIEKVLNLLDLESKLNLRLVSQRTRSCWIGSSNFIHNFQVPLQSDQDLANAINSYEEWNNFYFKTGLQNYDPQLISTFFTNYKSRIKVLFLEQFKWTHELNLLDNLQSLTISSLEFDLNDQTDEFRLEKLKTLSVSVVNFSAESELSLFSKLLQNFRNLENLKVPRPQPKAFEVTWVNLKSIQWELIIRPVINYLLSRHSENARNGCIKVLDVENVFSRHFGGLAEVCLETGTFLSNVNDKQVKYVFLNTEDVLQNIISIREHIDDRRPLLKWSHLERMFVRTSRCDVRGYYDQHVSLINGRGVAASNYRNDGLSTVTLPRLRSIHLVFDSTSRTDLAFLRLEKIVRLLIRTYRPNVQELRLQWQQFCHDTPQHPFDLYDIIRNFPGLRKLRFIGWGTRISKQDHENIIKQGLPLLTSIRFEEYFT